MLRTVALLVIAALTALAACSNNATPVQVGGPGYDAPPAQDRAAPGAALTTLPLVDLVGFTSGAYHTVSNNPAMYLDRDRKLFVMMGAHGTAELPSANPVAATTAFEAFLLRHGYAANGKAVPDAHQKVVVGGQQMVVMSDDELFPEMPADLKAHFTPAQYDALYKMRTSDCMDLVAARAPVIWAYTHSLVVVGPGAKSQEFPIDKADSAFAAFRAIAK